MGLLDGKVAIITGSGGGIGRAHALLFASEGAKLVINDLGGARDGAGGSSSMADQVVAEIKKMGGQAVANYASVATMDGAKSIVQSALDAFGRADILVNNAGILRDKTFLKMEEGMWDLVIAVHLKGTYLCSQVFGEHVRQRAEKGDKGGRIINTSSYAGLMGNYGQTNYAAAKAGIYGLTKVWALELAKLGITVNCIAPMAKTRMTEDISAIPDNMKAEHIAPMVLYLASDLAKDVNGRIFGIHGQQLLEYKMLMNEGVTKAGEEPWSAREIHEKLDQIGNFGQGGGGQPSLSQATGGAAAPKPMGPEQIIDQAFGLLPKVFVAERAKGWKATIHFDIAGASPWTVMVDEAGCRTEKGKAGSPTCVVNVDKDTYAAVVSGQTKPEKAFMEGKIKATNLGDMMKFGSAFDMKKARELATAAQAAPQAGAPGVGAAAAPATAEQIIDQAFGLLPKVFVAERAKGWKATIHFDIAGASPWTVVVDEAGCRTEKGKAGSPTCVVNVDKDTYAAVVSGQTKPEKAFMEGKIKATNLGDMMKFGSAFDMKKARELATQAAPAAGAVPAAAAPATAEQIIDQAFGLLPKVFVAERAKGWKATIHFDIAGASPWTVMVDEAGCRTEKGKAGSPTCVVNVDKDTYAAVVSGQTKPEKAFMEGKIKATNLGDMMKFGSAFDMKKAREMATAAGVGPGAGAGAAAAPPVGGGAPAGPEATVARAFELLPQAFKADRAAGWTAAIVFEVAGAGDWTVAIKDGTCTVTKGKAASPTCVVSVSVADYAKIVSGELKAEAAFMSKKLTATNLGDMMKFGGAFDMKKAAELLKSAAPAAAPAPAASGAAPSGKKGMNRAAIGKRFQAGEPQFVRPEHAVAYARATQDPNPWYLDAGRKGGPIAPPMFSVRLLKDIMFKTVGDPELGADLLLLVHGEQDMEFFRPLRPWDLVAARSTITGIEEKSTGEVVHFEETLYASGELAVRVKASIFVRDPGKKRDKGAAEPEAAAEEHKSLAFEEKITVAPNQSLLYADASLDNNPIHTDDGVAKMAGFPGVINQGLCTMAFAQKTVINAMAGGDPTKLKRLAVRFSKPVLMNDNLTVEGWDTGRKDGRSTYGFRVTNQKGEEVIKNGVAELAL